MQEFGRGKRFLGFAEEDEADSEEKESEELEIVFLCKLLLSLKIVYFVEKESVFFLGKLPEENRSFI